VTSSAYAFPLENGRTYHSVSATLYLNSLKEVDENSVRSTKKEVSTTMKLIQFLCTNEHVTRISFPK
jgi:hypothetical protein